MLKPALAAAAAVAVVAGGALAQSNARSQAQCDRLWQDANSSMSRSDFMAACRSGAPLGSASTGGAMGTSGSDNVRGGSSASTPGGATGGAGIPLGGGPSTGTGGTPTQGSGRNQ